MAARRRGKGDCYKPLTPSKEDQDKKYKWQMLSRSLRVVKVWGTHLHFEHESPPTFTSQKPQVSSVYLRLFFSWVLGGIPYSSARSWDFGGGEEDGRGAVSDTMLHMWKLVFQPRCGDCSRVSWNLHFNAHHIMQMYVFLAPKAKLAAGDNSA